MIASVNRRPFAGHTSTQQGASLVEVVMAMAILAIVVGGIYGVFVLAVKRAEHAQVRARIQQESRVAIDRIARELRETSQDPVAMRIYDTPCVGCTIGFRTARDPAGVFVLETDNTRPTYGQPRWQGVVYIYREGANIRRHADYSTIALAGTPVTTPLADPIMLSRLQAVEFQPSGSAIRIRLVAFDREELTNIQTDIAPENP